MREAGGSIRLLTITSAARPSSLTCRMGRVTQELIARGVIVDFRPGAGIRLAPHFYNTESEIDHAVQTMEDITITT